MAYNRAKVIGIDAGMRPPAEKKGMMSSTHWEVSSGSWTYDINMPG